MKKLVKPYKEPDFEDLRRVLLREPGQKVVPVMDLWVDVEVMSQVTGIEFPYSFTQLATLLGMNSEQSPENLLMGAHYAQLCAAFNQAVGYDYVITFASAPLPRSRSQLKDNPQQGGKARAWREEHGGLITNRKEFEAYPWPSPDLVNIIPVEYMANLIPVSMKQVLFYAGVFEDLTTFMGFENMAIKSIEEPELLGDILEQLTIVAEAVIDRAMAHPAVGALFFGEDMEFKTGTMLSPDFMRKWVLPCHKRIVDACHRHGKPFVLHSCGQIDTLMEDLIEVVGIDGKHSFQDNIEPVEQTYEKYGDRIAIIGGLDVDLLARGTEKQVRERTRQILEACAPNGNFCIGSGNSITDYCRLENFLAMLEEWKRWNNEHA